MNTAYLPIIAFLSFGTVIVQILVIAGFILYGASYKASAKSPLGRLSAFLGNNSIGFGFLIATCASLSTLFLSEIALLIPCELCWYQRIFMFPQIVILGIAILRNDTRVRLTALVLSLIGLGIALYHVLLQMYPAYFPCSDRAANCALAQFKFYGYVTIPVMSATAFSLIILLMLYGLRKK